MVSGAAHQDTGNIGEFDDKEFLLEDYKQKIGYLTAHFQRMWTRFNFIITIEAGVAAFMLTSSRDVAPIALGLVGVEIAVTLIWWVIGSQDRFLVRIYRKQVKDAADRLMLFYKHNYKTLPVYLNNYRYVGDVEGVAEDLRAEAEKDGKKIGWSPLEWRNPSISITRLAAIFPIVILVLWVIVGILILLFIPPQFTLP